MQTKFYYNCLTIEPQQCWLMRKSGQLQGISSPPKLHNPDEDTGDPFKADPP